LPGGVGVGEELEVGGIEPLHEVLLWARSSGSQTQYGFVSTANRLYSIDRTPHCRLVMALADGP